VTTRDALVDAIRAAPPDDLAPRLVLGDYLAERGDKWGELILAQCTKAEYRAKELLEDTSWFAPFHSPKIKWVFRLGLPVAFQLEGAFRYEWDHPDFGAMLFTLQFRSDNKCREEVWELTEQGPWMRGNGTYEVSPWSALRGHAAIVLRITQPPPRTEHSLWRPCNGDTSYAVLRGEQLWTYGTYYNQLMHHGHA